MNGIYTDGREINLAKINPERFWSKVEKGDDCWNWTAVKCGAYGSISIGESMFMAHRVSWALSFGPIPKGKDVCHKCDNPKCVRPDHLFLGSHLENMADKKEKGRCVRGEKSRHHLLTSEMVREIRRMISCGNRVCDVARIYSVSYTAIKNIKFRKTWAWLD